jgi:hypothetical protein
MSLVYRSSLGTLLSLSPSLPSTDPAPNEQVVPPLLNCSVVKADEVAFLANPMSDRGGGEGQFHLKMCGVATSSANAFSQREMMAESTTFGYWPNKYFVADPLRLSLFPPEEDATIAKCIPSSKVFPASGSRNYRNLCS